MSEQSIYEYITDHIVDGALPSDFSLSPFDKDDRQLLFADGAADGVAIYHTSRREPAPDLSEIIGRGIAQACAEDYESANATFSELGSRYPAIELIDVLQRYVMDRSEEIEAQELWAYSTFLLFFAADKELVKIGLSFLELFGEPGEKVKQVVRTLGLSDEFTLFAAWCARSWENGNEELFELAKKTDGWGRIHVVEMLAPETEEIREWLLYEGASNTVMPEYSALVCYVKAGVAERLGREMGHDEFSAITAIVHAALSDSPVAGLSSLEDPRAELARYVRQAGKQALDACDRECLDAIAAYTESRGWDDLAEECIAQRNRI